MPDPLPISPVPPSAAPAASAPLTPEQIAMLDRTSRSYRMMRRAAVVARSSALATLLIAACTIAWALFSFDWTGLLVGLALAIIGAVEFIGHRRLLQGQATAPRLLMRNQLALLALIALYCIVQMATFSAQRLKDEALPPDLRAQLAPAPDMTQMIDQNVAYWGAVAAYGFYSLVLLVSIACQGGLAWYYATRRRHVTAFNASPPWARQVLCSLS